MKPMRMPSRLLSLKHIKPHVEVFIQQGSNFNKK